MSAADEMRALAERMTKVSESLKRGLAKKRDTLPPAASAFSSATRMLKAIPARSWPVCGQCGRHVKNGGIADDAGTFFHSPLCYELARGRRQK